MAKKTNKMVKVSNNPVKFLKITVATLLGSMAAYGALIVLDWVYQKIRPLARTLYEYLCNDWRGILTVAGFFAVVAIIFFIDTAVKSRRNTGSGRKSKKKNGDSDSGNVDDDQDNISSYSEYNHYNDD